MNGWLIDTSALVRLGSSSDAEGWATRIERGLIRISTVTRLEVGFSARSGGNLRTALRQPPLSLGMLGTLGSVINLSSRLLNTG